MRRPQPRPNELRDQARKIRAGDFVDAGERIREANQWEVLADLTERIESLEAGCVKIGPDDRPNVELPIPAGTFSDDAT